MTPAHLEKLPELTTAARMPDRQLTDLALGELSQPIAGHPVNVQRARNTRTGKQHDARTHAEAPSMI
jgi:hypothetical protein